MNHVPCLELVNSSESIIICNFVFVRFTQGILLADNVRVLLSKFDLNWNFSHSVHAFRWYAFLYHWFCVFLFIWLRRNWYQIGYIFNWLFPWKMFSNWKFKFIWIVMLFMYLFEIVSSIWIFDSFVSSHVQIWNCRSLKLKSLSRLYDRKCYALQMYFGLPLELQHPISLELNHSL